MVSLQDQHGIVLFHQSGGCFGRSSPMGYPRADFVIGNRDVLLNVLDVGQGIPV
ncbi:DUF779 domain-containing protein [Mycobacterium leprae]|uniref:DUF779 domain-containing protein n=1 Tax=Mycobacterium leprae TaxID=1769 RepID=UPI00000B5041|nr:u1740a [Mycobacterium leprae]